MKILINGNPKTFEMNPVGWFEIPVFDMDRAKTFYEGVFNISIQILEMENLKMGWLPFDHNEKGCSGALVYSPQHYEPSTKGVLIYFASSDVAIELAKIEKAGGSILKGKSLISRDVGYMALFKDTEGNRIALHSKA